MAFDDIPHRFRTLDSMDQQAFDWTQPDKTASRGLMRLVYLFAGLVLFAILAAWLYATPARALPGSTQNPDGSWTGPNGEDLGGGKPQPEPRQSREGDAVGVLQCGCGYVVILRDGQSKAAAREACERTITETQRESCHWPNGVYPGDKG